MSKFVLDWETFYDSKQGYTLKKMTMEEYINDPRFYVFGFSIKRDGGTPHWVPAEKVEFMLRQLKLEEHTVIAHNAPFDMAILNWKYGVKPKRIVNTLAMARGVFGNTESLSLSALAEKLGVGAKGDAIVHMDGVRHPSTIMMNRLAEYAKGDADLCWAIYSKLEGLIPPVEQVIIDITTRMFTEPEFVLDEVPILRELELDAARREELLAAAGCELTDLRSDAKFAALLEKLGVQPPKKISAKKTAKAQKENPDAPPVYTWAFAKSDPDFKALAESEEDLVRWACEARLGLKSTIKQSRAQRFLSLAKRMGKLPVALTYYGAGTGRYAASSSEKINCFTGDTEVLTQQGWVRFDEWGGEPIMQWWPDGTLSWERTPGVVRDHHHGDIISIDAPCVAASVTPDHRFVTVNSKTGRHSDRTAQWIADHSGIDGVPVSGAWGGQEGGLSPDHVRLAVAISADGCVVGGNIHIGLRRQRKIIRLSELLNKLGVDYSVRHYAPQETHRGAAPTVVFIIKNPPVGKGYGPWVLRLSRESLDALVDELPEWDGQRHHKNGNTCFWTSDEEEAKWVQTALALSGIASSVRAYKRAGSNEKDKVLVYARSSKYTSVNTATHVTTRKYDGPVYCATVESSYILVRTGSKVFVSGQCQNLPAVRGSKDPDVGLLRKSIKAPPGKVVVVADASQIEARFVAWLSGQVDLVEAFAQKRDVYSEMASDIYGRHVDRKKNDDDYIPGFLGKCVTLGCFSSDTRVLTDSGWKDIVCVEITDKLWDGEEWVNHGGVICQGEKETETAYGLTATPDHRILVGGEWREWSEVHTSSSLLRSALSSASSPSLSGSTRKTKMVGRSDGIRSSGARVVWSILSTGLTFFGGSLRGVTGVLRKPLTILGRSIGGMLTLFPMTRLENGYLIESRPSYLDVGVRLTSSTTTTADAGSGYTARGSQTDESSYGISSDSTITATPGAISTGLTTTRGMFRGIYGLLQSVRTYATDVLSGRSKQRLMTYDIALAGPRNRFTVATNAGPLIVHNCGYGMSFIKFGQTVYGGMLGGPSILFNSAMADELGVDINRFAKWVASKPDLVARLKETMPAAVPPVTWITHMACAQAIVKKYRDNNPAIPRFWKTCDQIIEDMYEGREVAYGPNGILVTGKNFLRLPNGMKLLYKDLERNEKGEYSYLRRKEGRVQRTHIYGGALTENICQALAGAYVKEAMVRCYIAGYRPLLQVHDEIVTVADRDDAKDALRVLLECMTKNPAWAVGLPLAAEGDFADSYGEAK